MFNGNAKFLKKNNISQNFCTLLYDKFIWKSIIEDKSYDCKWSLHMTHWDEWYSEKIYCNRLFISSYQTILISILILQLPSQQLHVQVNNRNTTTRCELCLQLTKKTPEQSNWCRSGVFIVNFKHISCLVLVLLLFTLSRLMPAGFELVQIPYFSNNMSIEINLLFCYIFHQLFDKQHCNQPFRISILYWN